MVAFEGYTVYNTTINIPPGRPATLYLVTKVLIDFLVDEKEV